jgi:hypothetical protein
VNDSEWSANAHWSFTPRESTFLDLGHFWVNCEVNPIEKIETRQIQAVGANRTDPGLTCVKGQRKLGENLTSNRDLEPASGPKKADVQHFDYLDRKPRIHHN